jgi:hypothetical protein
MNRKKVLLKLIEADNKDFDSMNRIEKEIDGLAGWLSSLLPGDGEKSILPRGYIFQHWPTGRYLLEKMDGEFEQPLVRLTEVEKNRMSINEFQEDINRTRFLEDLALMLKAESRERDLASDALFRVTMNPLYPSFIQ